MSWHSQTWNWIDGAWVEGNPPLLGPRSHAFWLSTSVFDGARVFDGVMPDIRAHAERVNRSAATMALNPTMSADAIVELTREGARKFGPDAQLYVKPMYWAEADGISVILPDAESTRFCLCLFVAPMPPAGAGIALGTTRFRRPSLETMPTDAKAGCLYPNNGRALREAKAKGFDNALVLDTLGNVAETATSNVFLAKDGVVRTPVPNGTFLNGITRQRVIALLRADGVEVQETTLTMKDFQEADEIFTSGNYSKVTPVVRLEDRDLQPGRLGKRARELYWEFAHSG